MNGRVWVVEFYVGGQLKWIADKLFCTRDGARLKARELRAQKWPVRVRQYVRVE
jgi:hypothetical protein